MSCVSGGLGERHVAVTFAPFPGTSTAQAYSLDPPLRDQASQGWSHLLASQLHWGHLLSPWAHLLGPTSLRPLGPSLRPLWAHLLGDRTRRRHRWLVLLVGRSLLYCWPSVGWCVGVIKEANGDRRFKMEGEVVTSSTMRSTTTRRATSSSLTGSYGGDDVDSWVLLEALE